MQTKVLFESLERDTPTLRNSLKTRFALLTTLFICVTSISLGYVYSEGSRNIIYSQQHRIKLYEEKLQSLELFGSINNARRDIQVLMLDPTLISVVNSLAVDARASDAMLWKERLRQRFVSYMQFTQDYSQIRLIGLKNNGMEIVRVERKNGEIITAADFELQSKFHRDYYQDIIRLQPGQFYISEINLNRENGKVSLPYTPTIRIASPVYGVGNRLFGMLVVNIDLSHAFRAIKEIVGNEGQLFIINERGDYLLHPDKTREFAFDFGGQDRLQYDVPEITSELNAISRDGLSLDINYNNQEQILYAFNLARVLQDTSTRLVAVQIIPKDVLFQQVEENSRHGHIVALLITMACIIISLFFSRKMLAPMNFLARAVTSASNGKYRIESFPDAKDEVGTLSRAFRNMLRSIEAREKTIMENEERYRAIFCGASDGIVIVNQSGVIEDANLAFCELVGIDVDNVKGVNILKVVRDNQVNSNQINNDCSTCMLPVLNNGYATIISNSDISIPALLSINSFRINANEYFAAYIKDLSTHKKSESERTELLLMLRQAQKMESIGQMSSGIAHDFNNFLNCILGYAQLMRNHEFTDDKRSQYLDRIIDTSFKAQHMIEQLLAFSRKNIAIKGTSDVRTSVLEILTVLKHALTARIILTNEIEVDNSRIAIPAFQLQQIILNLCINARDAMNGNGNIHVHVRQSVVSEQMCTSCAEQFSEQYIEISVGDNGPGIADDVKQHIFEAFYTTKAEGEGTGLGLSMVNNIVHEANGHIVVESSSQGSVFRLYFPVIVQSTADEDARSL